MGSSHVRVWEVSEWVGVGRSAGCGVGSVGGVGGFPGLVLGLVGGVEGAGSAPAFPAEQVRHKAPKFT